MEPAASHGQIITFYSYKGGTGRTMAIANIACLLAQSYSKRVLVIDWDLEAPGLHRYFRNPIVGTPSWRVRSRAIDDDTHPGLIELLTELRRLVQLDLGITDEFHSEPKEVQSQDRAADCVAQLNFDPYLSAAPMKGVFVLKAGAFNDSYSHKISVFPWEDLYKASPWIFTAFADKLAQMFDFVLIDSRTGLTDTSGICTMLLPQTLVTVFTPNRQSLLGALQLAEKAANYRRKSSDVRPLLIMPLVSRVEAAKPELRDKWRFGDTAEGWVGFQPGFENLFKKIYELDDLTLKVYFDRIQLKHIPDYAYGEPIAVLIEKSDDLHSLRGVYSEFCARLVEGVAPWDLADEASVLNVQRDVAEKRAEAAELVAKKAEKRIQLAIGIGIALALVVLGFAANSYRQDQKNRIAEREKSAITSLRIIISTQLSYKNAYLPADDLFGIHRSPYACTLAELVTGPRVLRNAQFVGLSDMELAAGAKDGYQFQLTCTKVKIAIKPLVELRDPALSSPSSRLRVSPNQSAPAGNASKLAPENVVGYTVTATPVAKTSSARHFCSTEDGIIRQLQSTEPCPQGKPL